MSAFPQTETRSEEIGRAQRRWTAVVGMAERLYADIIVSSVPLDADGLQKLAKRAFEAAEIFADEMESRNK